MTKPADIGARVAECMKRPAYDMPASDWRAVAREYEHLAIAQAGTGTPEFDIASIETPRGGRAAVTEQVVDVSDFCTLRKFSVVGNASDVDAAARNARPAVILCTPLAGHHAIMFRETVETLLEQHDVYVTDWADAHDVPMSSGAFDFARIVDLLGRFFQSMAPLHVLAICQATLPALVSASLLASQHDDASIKTIAVVGGPIDARLAPTTLDRFASRHSLDWFREHVVASVPDRFRGAGRRVVPSWLQRVALMTAQPFRSAELAAEIWQRWICGDMRGLLHAMRVSEGYAAVIDLDEAFFLDTVRIAFQQFEFARGVLEVDHHRVQPDAIRHARLATIEGENDGITGAGQTHAAHALCTGLVDSARMKLTVDHCDHYDLFIGARWRTVVHPALCSFWNAA